ncbi:MAG: PT domain-containing protein, partial [Clostridia bacterium]|nr:PT domain-containing protein [Clostridia bacterium]
MKKLLILATLLLVLVVAVVACTETPAGPGEESTVEATQEPATDAPTEEPTQAPTEAPTDAPTEEPTDAPTEEPTDAPVTEEPTEEPTEAPTEPPVDPNAPLHTVAPDFLANYAAQTGNMVCCNDLGTTESLTEAGRTFFRLTSAGGDPYIAFIDGSKNLKVGRYMAISYRTNSAKVGQFFMGSGQGWTGNGDQFLQDWNEDGNWNLAIIDLDNVGLTALTDYVLNYARLDFFTEAGAEGDYFDVEYIGFFSSAEAAEKYNFEMHKAPMWDADKSVIAHQSFDQFYYGNGSHDEAALDENLTLYHAANRPDWDFVADMEGKDHEYLTYWGWVATKSETIGQFGYQFNGGTPVYDAAWTHATEQPVIDAAKQLGGVNG